MLIQKITPQNYFNKPFRTIQKSENPTQTQYSTNPLNITFEARVDKGLTRFYETNAHRMPKTVKTYIENLTDKTSKTPLQAQAAAFSALAGITTIASIKATFEEDEDLFKDLKDPSESKATRGILNVYRENKDLLEIYDQSILANKENFTVWLVKKVFLEGKTLEEINQDFDREIDRDFLDLYKIKQQESQNKEQYEQNGIIRPSTLKALGIKLPEFEYLQSLRYTREGYSDIVGDKISQAQRDFYASLPIEERTARARKSVQKFENWWKSMTRDEQLDIIAEQIDELEMLKRFNSSEIGKTRTSKTSKGINKGVNEEVNNNPNETRKSSDKVKVDSTLSRDDLFKIWAGNNLKLFRENLTDYDKQRIETKREQRRAEWWNSMSPKERTDYINKLRTSTEPLRFAMIDAWNKNQDILIELSHTLKKNHFEKPTEILFGTKEFNEYMSQIMTDFWASNPDFAYRIGESIRESHDRIKDAISNGNFELIKREINGNKTKREKEVLDAVKNYRVIISDEVYEAYPQYMKDFIDTYNSTSKLLPVKYLREYYDIVATELPPDVTASWTKALKNEDLTNEDLVNIEKIQKIDSPRTATTARALEATLADILYECTQNPAVYLLSQADCKMAIKQIAIGRENITILSHKLNREFIIPILNRDIDIKKIDKLYDEYTKPLFEGAEDAIIDQFIEFNYDKIKTIEEKRDLVDYLQYYIKEYGNSNSIIFDGYSTHSPEVKSNFAAKFLENLPKDLDRDLFKLKVQTVEDFKREEKLHKIDNLMRKKYNFLPQDAFNMYAYELNKVLRNASSFDVDEFENKCCKPRKTSTDISRIIILSKAGFSATHKVFSLCLEQALADLIYESCGNEEVYAFQMEELFSYMEAIMLIKKFPMKEANEVPCNLLGRNVELNLKHRIQPYQIEKKFREYYQEMVNYINECADENKNLSKEEMLYVLNPDENKPRIDELTKMRIDNTIPKELLLND